jgi:hypothetical protein
MGGCLPLARNCYMQIDTLNRAECTAIYSDHGSSGAGTDRPALRAAKARCSHLGRPYALDDTFLSEVLRYMAGTGTAVSGAAGYLVARIGATFIRRRFIKSVRH